MPRALSIYLDLLRFSAALLVFIVHANYDRFTDGLPLLWRFSGLGNDAVMVFFVLSGFVIAYVSEARERSAPTYFAARLARLWSVAIPAIALTIALDHVGINLSPAVYDGWWFENSTPILRTIANLGFVNELWFWSIRPFSNGPYWSIGYEFWYYTIFGALIFLKGRIRIATIALLLLFVGPKILLLFPVWLMGVWAYRTKVAAALSPGAAVLLLAFTTASYVVLRATGSVELLNDFGKSIVGKNFAVEKLKWSQYFLSSYCIGILIAANFVAARRLSAAYPDIRVPGEKVIAYFAGFTFSLYLLHYPLLQFFAAVANFFELGGQKRMLVVGGTLCVVWLIGSWAERQKTPLRRLLLKALQAPSERRSQHPE